jgi:AraC-like DNA-binding protein
MTRDNVLEEAHYNGDIVAVYCKSQDPTFYSKYHMHPYYELNFIFSHGKMDIFNHDNHFVTDEPCVIIHRPMTIHRLNVNHNGVYERVLLDIGPRVSESIGEEFFPIAQLCEANMSAIYLRGELYDYCRRILTELQDRSASRTRRTLLTALLLERLAREARADENVIHTGHRKDFYINDVLRLLYERFHEDLRTEEIAERFFVSRAKLNRDFEEVTGTSIKQYILRLRISHAKFLLRRGGDCGDVAKQCGFGNAQYFNRVLRRMEGQTPGQYVRQSDPIEDL